MKLNKIVCRHWALSGVSFEPAIATMVGKNKKWYKLSPGTILLLTALKIEKLVDRIIASN